MTQGAQGRSHSRFHPRPVGPDLHAVAGLVRRRRDQGRASRRRRHHARPAAGHAERRTACISPCSTTTSARSRSTPRTRRARKSSTALIKSCDVLVENFGPGALDRMGFPWETHPGAQPEDDRRLDQGLRSRPLRRLQGLRERRAMHRRRGIDHRLPRRPAAGHRRADRRQRHRPASRARHRHRALSAHRDRPGPEGRRRDAGRRAQPLPRQAARPAAPRARPAEGIQPVSAKAFRSATRCRAPATIPAAASPAASSSARAGRPIPTPTSTSSPRRRCGRRSAT